MQIREEQPADHATIHHLTKVAFEPKAFSDGTEPDIINRLRADGDLTLSLVAENKTGIVGHVAFSPVVIGESQNDWFGLGPVSVHPDVQRRGIGSALINHGLEMLCTGNAKGCALIGDPKYYSRFGFISDGNVTYGELPVTHVQWISFSAVQPTGELIYRPAFSS